jgi:selenocysteine lyase/cysteine desulfurase
MDRETGHLDPADLERLLDDKVRLVCFPHVSNVVGEVNDVAAIVEKVHAAGAVACVDGVAAAPHGLPDVRKLGADIYLFSAYKTYGPHQGIMVLRADLCRRLPSQGHFFNSGTLYKRFTQPDRTTPRWRPARASRTTSMRFTTTTTWEARTNPMNAWRW